MSNHQEQTVDTVFFMYKRGRCPMMDWLSGLRNDKPVLSKYAERVERLKKEGHRLKRPLAEHVEGPLYALIISSTNNREYRVFYFFHEQKHVILTHSFLKVTQKIPINEIHKALDCYKQYLDAPDEHTYKIEDN